MGESARELRVALLGYGLGGACFSAPLIAATPGLRLASVLTRDPGRRAQALREHPGVRVVERAEWIWEHAREHDLAVISTTNRTHVPLALAALDAGLPVVIDKPIAPSAAQAREVLERAQRAGLFASAYHLRRWDAESLTARALIDAGALGRVLRFESRLERWRPQLRGHWRELGDPEEAGGLLFDLGSHLIDQALHLFGPVAQVYAELDSRRPGAQIDDDVFIALTHASGVRSHLWASALAALPGPRLRVLGDRGAFLKQHADLQEAALRAGGRPGDPGWGEDPAERWGVLADGEQSKPVPSRPGCFQEYWAAVVRSLREGAPPPVSLADAVTGLEIIAAAQRSAAQGGPVELVSSASSR